MRSGVTRTAIDKARGKHEATADALLAGGLVDDVNTAQCANTFRKLEDVRAITAGIEGMRRKKNT